LPFGLSKVKINRGFHQFPPHVGKGKFLIFPHKRFFIFKSPWFFRSSVLLVS